MAAYDPRAEAARKFAQHRDPDVLPDIIGRYATDPPLVVRTLVDALRPAASVSGARVCELGPGAGWLLQELAREYPRARLAALDRSPAMLAATLEAAGPSVEFILGDMEGLPFADGALDAITTNWTLYFMADIDAALAGIARSLRPGGIFVAATNARDHMVEFWDLAVAAVVEVGGDPPRDTGERFDLTSGPEYVARHFPGCEVREWSGEMRLPDAATVMRLWPNYGPQGLPPGIEPRARAAFERLVAERIAREGHFTMRRRGGAFVAMKKADPNDQ